MLELLKALMPVRDTGGAQTGREEWFQPLQARWKVPGWDVLAGSCADAMTRNLCMRHGTGRWLRPGPGGDRR